MSGNQRPAWFVAVVAAAAVVVFVILQGEPAPEADIETPAELADQPDLHMEGATIRQFREDGTLKYDLEAVQIRHFESEEITRLRQPHLSLDQEDAPPWQIEAAYGYIRNRTTNPGESEEVVYLREGVMMEQRHPDGRFVRLKTPSIYLYPDRQYAETTQNVMIDTEAGRTHAVGLQGQLERGLLNLYSSPEQRVHTIVLRGQFKPE